MRICQECNKPFPKTRYHNGRKESSGQYSRRKFCSKSCADLARFMNITKICKKCGTIFKRHRLPCGRLESTSYFLSRSFCSNACAAETRRRYMAYHFGRAAL
jgi:hypothetical protein